MLGSIYINEIAPEKCSLDFSASPSELLDTDSCYGFAYMKTLKHLGVKTHREESTGPLPRLVAEGSTAEVKAKAPELHKHIGLIARYGAARSRNVIPLYDRYWTGRILGTLTQDTLPNLSSDVNFVETMAFITEPFADSTKLDGVVVSLGYEAPWTREKVQEGLSADNPARGLKTVAQQIELWFDDEITSEVRAQTEEVLGGLRSLFPNHSWDSKGA